MRSHHSDNIKPVMKFCRTYHDLTGDFIPSGKRIAVNQGGTRSGKTYSIMQFLIETAIRASISGMSGRVITICRKTLPALKATAMRDFIEILENIGYYSEQHHNKSERQYHLMGSMFEFISLDQPSKVRGRKRDILFVNEANELTLEDWRQLMMRTTDKVIIDYNPSDEYHWIYDKVIPREDAAFYITTYKDNPFLQAEIIQEIERLKVEDENYWKIYGLGEKGVSQATVYPHWREINELPPKEAWADSCYGLDFGFNNPSCLMQCIRLKTGELVWNEIFYRSHLTNTDLISLMRTHDLLRVPIYCDSAEQDRILELQRAGFKAVNAVKVVKDGIDKVRSVPLLITSHSAFTIKEVKNYKYKVNSSDEPQEEPVKFNDHAMDAGRYGSFNIVAERKVKARVGKMVQ